MLRAHADRSVDVSIFTPLPFDVGVHKWPIRFGQLKKGVPDPARLHNCLAQCRSRFRTVSQEIRPIGCLPLFASVLNVGRDTLGSFQRETLHAPDLYQQIRECSTSGMVEQYIGVTPAQRTELQDRYGDCFWCSALKC